MSDKTETQLPTEGGSTPRTCSRSSDTPETDAITNNPITSGFHKGARLAELSRKLERERDALADAIRPFTTLNPKSPRVAKFWDGFVATAREALRGISSENEISPSVGANE